MLNQHVLVASRGPGFGALLLRPGRPVLALVASLTLAAGAAHAQAEPVYESGNFIPSPLNLQGLYHGIVSGDLNGDLSPEVAVIKGSHLIVFRDADVGNESICAACDAIDVCYSPDAAGPGHAGLLYTTLSGLKRLTVQAGEPDIYTTLLLNDSSLWCGALQIRSGAGVGPGPGQGLVGVDEDELYCFSAFPSGGGFMAPSTMFEFNHGARDIALMDWNGLADGKKEIGILHNNGIQVRDQLGTYLLARSAVIPGDAIAVVRKTGLSDSLAWVTRFSSGPNLGSNLLVFNQGFPGLYQPAQWLGSRVFASLASGDLEGDGDGDLVLGAASWSSLAIHENDSSAATWFSPTPTQEPDLRIDDDPATLMVPISEVLCANLFNDWVGNTPIPSYAAVLVNQDGLRLIPNLSGRYSVFEGDPPADFTHTELVYPCSNPHWELTLGDGWGQTTATHVELIVRMKPNSLTVLRPAGLRHLVFALNGEPIPGKVLSFVVDNVSGATPDNDIYFAMVRPIHIDEPNPTTLDHMDQAWRWSILGLDMDEPGQYFLSTQPGHGEHVGYEEGICEPQVSMGGSRYIPSPVLQSHLPSSGNVQPSIPAATFIQ